MAEIWIVGNDGEAVAHRHGSQGDNWDLNQLLMEDHQTLVGAGEAGGLSEVPHWGQDQST
jgi:hypothetical protein